MPRQKHKRNKTAEKTAEPGEPKSADQYRRIGYQLSGAFQNVVQTCSHQAGESGDTDNKKSFVVMARLAGTPQVAALQELSAAAVKICLQEVGGGQQAESNHEAEIGNCDRPKMEKWKHRWRE